jgi:hypothetical protein
MGGVIRDLDTTLSAWLGALVPDVPVTFGVLDPQASSDGSSSLWLHLYDVHEEASVGAAGWMPVRDADGRTVGRVPPLRRYRFRYLLAASAKGTLDEHELLGRVLAGCALHETVPAEHLSGALASAEGEVLVRCAPVRVDGQGEWDQSWRAARRTSLELSVLAPLLLDVVEEVGPAPRSIELGSSRLGPGRDGEPRPDRPGPARPAHRITEGSSPRIR